MVKKLIHWILCASKDRLLKTDPLTGELYFECFNCNYKTKKFKIHEPGILRKEIHAVIR